MPQRIAKRGPLPFSVVSLLILVLVGPLPAVAGDSEPSPGIARPDNGNRRVEDRQTVAGGPLRRDASDRTERGGQRQELSVKIVQRAASSKAIQQSAIDDLPFRQMTAENRKRTQEILRSLSMFRRLATIEFKTHADAYAFFATHPDAAVSIWRAMEISKFQMWQTGPAVYEVESEDGSLGVIEVLHSDSTHKLVLCHGAYNNPLLIKPIQAIALMHLRTSFSDADNGLKLVTHYVDLFVSFPSQTVETAAKVISPISYLIADRNFREISLFVQLMSQAMQNQPGWVERLVGRMDGVLDVRKDQLLKITAKLYVDARKHQLARTHVRDGVRQQDVMAPLRTAMRQPTASGEATGAPRGTFGNSDRPAPSDNRDDDAPRVVSAGETAPRASERR